VKIPVGDPFFKMMAAAPLLSQIAARNLYAHAATAIGVDPGQNVYGAPWRGKTVINCRGNMDLSERFPGIPGGSASAGRGFQVFRQYDRTAAGAWGGGLSELTGAESGIVTSGSAGGHGRRNGGLHGRHRRPQDLATAGHHGLEA